MTKRGKVERSVDHKLMANLQTQMLLGRKGSEEADEFSTQT